MSLLLLFPGSSGSPPPSGSGSLHPTLPVRWVITPADAADDPDVFPYLIGQSFLLLKTPLWNTKTDIAVNGVERRRALWSYPVWRFRLAHEVLRDTVDKLELQRLVTFFNMKAGMCQGFFYKDRFDNAAVSAPLGTGDGVTTAFQPMRQFAVGGLTFAEPVRGFDGNPTIYVNGVATMAFTVSTFGIVTFTTAPANGATLTWSGNYFFLCRFDADELDLSQFGQGFWQSGQFDFRSWKPA